MRWEITFWLVVALLVGILLGAAIMWAASSEPVPPDCTFQDTPGNWQPGCAHVH